MFGVWGGEVDEVLRVCNYRVEPDLPDAPDEGFGVQARRGHGPTLGVGDEDLDRLQPLFSSEPQCFLQPVRGRQVPSYPVRACFGFRFGFDHATDSSGLSTGLW